MASVRKSVDQPVITAVQFIQVELPHHVHLIPRKIESAMGSAEIHANSLSEVRGMYNAVGINVPKGKNTIAVLQPDSTVIRKPFDVSHVSRNLNGLADCLDSLESPSKIAMGRTGRCHEPMFKALYEAELLVSVVNPHLIKNFSNSSLYKVKSDPTDACRAVRYTLDNQAELHRYLDMNDIRTQLRTLNSQFSFFMKQKAAAKANLIILLDDTYPGVDKLFNNPVREDGNEKWVDHTYSLWCVDCVREIGLKTFIERYEAFCKKHHYIFQQGKPEKLFSISKELVAVLPKERTYKLLVQQNTRQLNPASGYVGRLRQGMNALASTLSECNTVAGIYGVGKTYSPLLIVGTGNVSRFIHREALIVFIGADPGVGEFGQHKSKSNRVSKVGFTGLRETLFQIMATLLQDAPVGDPAYRFLNKKRVRGKPYYVYMTAGANKFLRIYYGKVKKCLQNLKQAE